jgi:hypothetical protein
MKAEQAQIDGIKHEGIQPGLGRHALRTLLTRLNPLC